MDDSDVERIISQVEKRYGKSRMEYASEHTRYRRVLLDAYIYGDLKQRQEREAEGKRAHISVKQDIKLRVGVKAYARYGRIDIYTIRAMRTLMKKGKA